MDLREQCLNQARKAVRDSIDADNFIIQAIANIEDVDRSANGHTSRLREWYGLYLPELAEEVRDNEAFITLILRESKEKLMKQLDKKESMGADLEEADLIPILQYAETIVAIFALRKNLEKYLESKMEKYCKNLQAVAGTTVGAKLLAEAGSLKRLATFPSTTIQLLGAEKALFRHLKTGAKPPRHGHIFAHPIVQKTKDKDRGKAARALADKIAIAARADYFGKKFIGADLRKELEAKFDGA